MTREAFLTAAQSGLPLDFVPPKHILRTEAVPLTWTTLAASSLASCLQPLSNQRCTVGPI